MKLVEVVVALLLGVFLLIGTWHQATSIRVQAARADSIVADWEARRVVGLSLDLDAGGVVGAGGPDEVAVRAYRWWGAPCVVGAGGSSAVLFATGSRGPDTGKDSLLLIDDVGRSFVRRLDSSRRSTACGGGAIEVGWAPSIPREPVLVRGFERGAYRIDAAFRYRRGAGGAQPLTAERFVPDSVGLRIDSSTIALRLAPLPARRWNR